MKENARTGSGDSPGADRRGVRRLALAAVLASLLGGGCITTGPLDWINNGFKVGPNYCRPPAPAAPEWIQSNDSRVQSRRLPYLDWWNVFQDPILDSLINTAYNQNLNLRVIATRVLQARAQQAVAVGNLFPQTVQAQGSYSRTALSKTIANNPAAIASIIPTSTPAPFTPLFGNWYSLWSLGLNASWELDFWGRYRRGVESANANLDASVEAFDDALVTLLGDVATNYVQYRVAQQRIKLARANVKIQEEILALVERQQKVGINRVTMLDVNQARTVLEQTRSTIPALEIVRGQANDALCILLGMPPRDLGPELGPGPDVGQPPMPTMPGWVAAGVPADLLRRRPDIRRAERQVAVQSAQVGVAEADLYPSIYVNGTVGVESESLSKLFEGRSFFGTIMPGFRWNILNSGRILNNVRLQQARVQELIAAYQNQVLTAAREVQTPLRGFLRSQEQAQDLTRSVTAATGALNIGRDQYRVGTIPFNTVFNLETTQVLQQDNLAVAQGNIALNLISVYRALGGGWELRLQPARNGGSAEACAGSPPGAETMPTIKLVPQTR